MEANKFSVSECLRAGVTGVLDNFRLFFLSNLALGLLCMLVFAGAAALNWPFINEVITAGQQAAQEATVEQETQAPAESMPTKMVKGCKGMACSMMQSGVSYFPILQRHWLKLFITGLLALFLLLGFGLGYTKFMLDFYDTGTARVSVLFSELIRSPKVFIAGVIYLTLMLLGFVFFFIPGIILMLRLIFFVFAIADKNAGPLAALRTSWLMTRGYTWQLFAISLVIFALASLSTAVFLASPIVAFVHTCVYRRLPKV